MASLLDMVNRLKSINLNDILDDSVMETKDSLLGENKFQLLSGKAIDGSVLGHYRDPDYANFKSRYGGSIAPFGVYNFNLYGDFQDAMYVRPLLTEIEIGSLDGKESKLEKLAGGSNRVFGLPANSDYPQQIFKPVYLRRIKEFLNI
jgi:hypothetical protein